MSDACAAAAAAAGEGGSAPSGVTLECGTDTSGGGVGSIIGCGGCSPFGRVTLAVPPSATGKPCKPLGAARCGGIAIGGKAPGLACRCGCCIVERYPRVDTSSGVFVS